MRVGWLAGRDEGLEEGKGGGRKTERHRENVLVVGCRRSGGREGGERVGGEWGGVEKSRGNFSTFTLIPKCVGGKT